MTEPSGKIVARPLVAWALPCNSPVKIGCGSLPLVVNGADSLTFWLMKSFSGRKAYHAPKRTGTATNRTIHLLRRSQF